MDETVVSIHVAKISLSRLVARAERGERSTIARDGKLVAQLGPVSKEKRPQLPADDPLLNLAKWGFDGSSGRLDRVMHFLRCVCER